MALSPVSGVRSGAGFRSCTLFALDSNGYPLATSPTTPYEGVTLSGAKVLTLTDPEPRKIFHPGDDSIIVSQLLPPQEGLSAELRAGKMADAINALVTGQKAFTAGEMSFMLGGTDKRGFEPSLGMLSYQSAPDADWDNGTAGLQGWNGIVFPQCKVFQRENGFNDQAMDRMFTVMPLIVSRHLWGTQFTEATEGANRSQYVTTYGRGRPKLLAWLGNATATAFTFPTGKPALTINKVTVWVNGVLTTTGITVTTTSVTFTTAPAAAAVVVVLYEY